MKYVMLQVGMGSITRNVPFIFPDQLCHDDMALFAAEAYRASHGNLPLEIKAVSAGFINMHVESTHGKSETLGLQSKAEDAKVVNIYDYFHGLV